ncbi:MULTISPECIES: type 1 glutamine amidotransferase [Nitrosopumilus]|uniref:Glutamine amidotransferase class-I n=1 Tax=Nitrosopumilus piranensis TaxID=1582439 RepID=A0A0C5CA72_9ARCH|nr:MULTISPECIES: type 1 glutamine amidotransferase [Nitrosopumilus]AJM92027.1 Glutamine amidotransferase class-I [Nitrosopumilus piranensis]KAF6245231.1 GMP synthase [Nitrosopumilus sp. b2]
MSDVLLVQNTRIEGSGYLGDLLKTDGFHITSINAKHESIPDKNFSLVVILGAPESANDDLPYLKAEQQLIKNSVEKDIPVLGICLGSQLIAKTFGGKVYSGTKTEIGFYNDLKINNKSTLFSGFSNPFTVFHWHGDTFDLPDDAVRLASSEYYQNQAFQYKSAVGLQFHIEVNEEMVNLWLDNTEEKIKQIPGINPQKIRSDINENISIVKSNMENFYNNYKSEFHL